MMFATSSSVVASAYVERATAPRSWSANHWERLSHLEHINGPVVIIQEEEDRYGART